MISTNLKMLRQSHKYTQEEVADRMGVSRQAVAKWEKGITVPDINNCIALAELYDVTLDDLVKHAEDEEVGGIQPKGKHLFGFVKVSERGQIVIPKRAREIFKIYAGDSLMVLGDEAQGLALVQKDKLIHFIEAVSMAEENTD
ncbi:AbrB family looped-hinge helix DNA binding protein [Cytobacillus eiseniae]|uniref:AbrB family looped-hinge helix DNA binding protein n=1 Tax=Cytobacillus eiseniae TaxID=762947 RepID=A0ABS4RFV9_9BACI|nr:helix-turn-helix domain-containing protein [Cytobacillus eiseniae]MBP2241792.1 AbrB family looped-hinge helix DNA binding protein [Cytobacillus eiseniae]